MPSVVECCVSNLTSDGRKAIENSEHDVRFSFCLDRCGRCHEDSFLVIDGDPISGESYDEILAKYGGNKTER